MLECVGRAKITMEQPLPKRLTKEQMRPYCLIIVALYYCGG
jgi:hypothetical protein